VVAVTAGDWSVPETEVMSAIAASLDGRPAVLATVVGVEGSAYRRPGAKMLITDDSDGFGSITAGCLEDEVLSLAREVLVDDRPRLERFDLTGDDDVWGLGVGCNGVIDVLLEPLDASYRAVTDAYERGDNVSVVTVLDADAAGVSRGDRTFGYPTGGSTAVTFEDADLPADLLDEFRTPAARLLEAGKSDAVTGTVGGEPVEVFVDSVTAPPELAVFGDGHDVGPVAEMAARADFRVTVVTFRGGAADGERFPAADRVVSTSPADIREVLDVDRETYAVLMTHNFVDDRLALEELLGTPMEYVGLMGPRGRFEEMREEFATEGRTFTEAELDRVYTPAGLDLGGGTPLHIAQSIVAEVMAVHHGREPRHLSERAGPIHERSPVDTD
jgi:xanthine dehydrogenase accessory factor